MQMPMKTQMPTAGRTTAGRRSIWKSPEKVLKKVPTVSHLTHPFGACGKQCSAICPVFEMDTGTTVFKQGLGNENPKAHTALL